MYYVFIYLFLYKNLKNLPIFTTICNLIVYYIYIHRYLYIITYYLYPLCAAAMLGGVVWTLSVAALLLLDPAHPRATQVIVISRYFSC